ncbi:putative pentatricopeptide repeat-containing protein-like [Capsicum annuum]|nr:putative pentatricopeptide repeat-containing protein-like [Capsicum annuum]
MEIVREQAKSNSDESLKLAVAMAILRSKLLHKPPSAQPPPPPPYSSTAAAASSSDDDALKWKRKAKERKQEIVRLKEDLKVAEDGSQYDLFPKSASCKCYFFDELGLLSPKRTGDCSDQQFSDVLRRRFLRQERDNETNVEQLSTSVDFLLELCDTLSPQSLEECNFKNWCHQAVDFILGTLATMSPTEKNREPVEGIINSLIMRLLRRMCSGLQGDESHHFDTAVQFYIQHLMRKIGNEAFVGQRLIFAVSQRISAIAESLLFMDPFDAAFPRLFEEWFVSVLQGRKALELLENRNSLYVLYIDRVIGVVAKQVGQLSFLQKLSPQILENLYS